MALISPDRDVTLLTSQLKILFLLEDCFPVSNAKIARILRKYPQTTFKDLKYLTNTEFIQQNMDQEYVITETGLDLINKSIYRTTYYEELREHIKKLKEKPEKKRMECQPIKY